MSPKEQICQKLQTLPKFVDSYIKSIQDTSINTQLAYLTDIEAFLEYLADCKDIPVCDISAGCVGECSREFFDDYFFYLREYEKDGAVRTNGPPGIRRKLAALRGLTTYLYDEDLIPANPITKVRVPKITKKPIERLKDSEISSLLFTAENGYGSEHHTNYLRNTRCRDLAIIAVLLSTGIRVSELTMLNLNNIDMESCSLKVLRKGGNEQIVYFGDDAAEYLADYLYIRSHIAAEPGHENALFLSMQRKRITTRSVQILLKNYGDAALPLRNLHPHLLRKTYGSRMYDETGDAYLIASLLGHKSVETTAKHYISSEKDVSEVRNKVPIKEEGL